MSGYEAAFSEEIQYATDIAGAGDSMKYLHFRVAPHSRVDSALAKLFLHAHVAHASGRVYVFDPLEPIAHGGPSTLSRKKVQPLSSVLNVGKSWDTKGRIPRPISSLGWHYVCPKRQRKLLYVSPQDLANVFDPGAHMTKWIKKLERLDTRCVEVVGELFTESILESLMIQGLYDTLLSSPVLKQYTFRPNIYTAAAAILPIATQTTLSPTANNTVTLHTYLPPDPLNELDDPCSVIASRGVPFQTFAHVRDLPTAFVLPATKLYYKQRCNPTVKEIVGRLGMTRSNNPTLKHVYVVDGPLGMSPEQWTERKRWFEELRFELTTKYGWESVRWAAAGAKPESVAIDTELATRSLAYLGNGFSDFSSNVVLLRSAQGLSRGTLRFL